MAHTGRVVKLGRVIEYAAHNEPLDGSCSTLLLKLRLFQQGFHSLSLSFYPYRFHSSVNESIQRGDPKSEQRPAVSGITRVQRLRSGPASEPRVPLKRATEERKEEREIPSARRGLANSWLNAQLTEASPRGRPAWPARVPLDGGRTGA